MDRYVIREPRAGADYPQGNQLIAFSANPVSSNNNMISPSDNVYCRSYGAEFSNMQRTPNLGYVGFSYTNSAQPFVQSTSPANQPSIQSQMLSGIDPRYLTGYANNGAQFIAGQQIQGQSSTNNASFTMEYPNQNYLGPDINNLRTLPQNVAPTGQTAQGQESRNNLRFGVDYQNQNVMGADRIYNLRTSASSSNTPWQEPLVGPPRTETPKPKQLNVYDHKNFKGEVKQEYQSNTCASHSTPTEKESTKNSGQSKAVSRLNKLDVLYKRGLLVFSGPVEKVLKWHKSLQDIGVLALYEIVAKCVSVRPGESCAMNLVVRDENGPAMQIVYYEIDFQLPMLKLPCTVRVVGKMMVGTCRLQAFKVRPATGDDVAMLPRRAAVSAHHITKLSKEIENI